MGMDPPSKSALVEPKCEPALETTLEDDEYYSFLRIMDNGLLILQYKGIPSIGLDATRRGPESEEYQNTRRTRNLNGFQVALAGNTGATISRDCFAHYIIVYSI